MARSRNIKPGFYKNEDLAECSIWARFIFPGLWMIADRNGLLEDRPKRLKAELLPFDTMDVEPLLVELHERLFIFRYSNEQGNFICIPSFPTHQSPHYSEKESGIKRPILPEKWKHRSSKNLGEVPKEPEKAPENSRSDALIKRGSQPPDSLIPDSLIPDSTQSPIKRSTSARPPTPDQAVAALRVLIEADKRITLPAKGRMHLGQWATEGVTPAQLTQAIRLARARKPHPELIPFAYLVPIVEDVKAGRAIDPEEPRGKAAIPEALARIEAREKRERKVPALHSVAPSPARETEPDDPSPPGNLLEASGPEGLGEGVEPPTSDAGEELAIDDQHWWEDPERVMARAVELNVAIFEGENFGDFTARVLAELGPGPHLAEIADEALLEKINYFQRVGPTSDAARPQPA